MQRMGMTIGIDPDKIGEYKRLHAACWPEILRGLTDANIRNYSIFLRQPENVMFAYWEYNGTDFDADMKKIADQDVTNAGGNSALRARYRWRGGRRASGGR